MALYLSAMDRAWAINARTGEQIWSYFFKTRGTAITSTATRAWACMEAGFYFVTPDACLVSLDAKTGKERWYKQLGPAEMDYYGSTAPLVVGNHVFAGVGGDALDLQGFLEARDAETGDVQWKWYSTPQNPGDPGYDSWPDEYSPQRKHGGGGPWQPLTYDPDLNLVYVTTGNPNPVGCRPRAAKVTTCLRVRLWLSTPTRAEMAWYYQTSPHDAHDFDSTEAPVLFDGTWQGTNRESFWRRRRGTAISLCWTA